MSEEKKKMVKVLSIGLLGLILVNLIFYLFSTSLQNTILMEPHGQYQ